MTTIWLLIALFQTPDTYVVVSIDQPSKEACMAKLREARESFEGSFIKGWCTGRNVW